MPNINKYLIVSCYLVSKNFIYRSSVHICLKTGYLRYKYIFIRKSSTYNLLSSYLTVVAEKTVTIEGMSHRHQDMVEKKDYVRTVAKKGTF